MVLETLLSLPEWLLKQAARPFALPTDHWETALDLAGKAAARFDRVQEELSSNRGPHEVVPLWVTVEEARQWTQALTAADHARVLLSGWPRNRLRMLSSTVALFGVQLSDTAMRTSVDARERVAFLESSAAWTALLGDTIPLTRSGIKRRGRDIEEHEERMQDLLTATELEARLADFPVVAGENLKMLRISLRKSAFAGSLLAHALIKDLHKAKRWRLSV